MKFSFENEGTYAYLVCEVEHGDTIDMTGLRMLTNNKIHGIAPTFYTQMDDSKYIKYNVSSKVTMKQFFTGPVNKRRLVGVFSGIVSGLIAAEDYMIDSNTILFDLDYIFVDVSSYSTALISLPIREVSKEKKDFRAFFKNIMFNIQSDQSEDCSHVAEIINYFNSASTFSLSEFKRILDGLLDENASAQASEMSSVQKRNEVVSEKKSVLDSYEIQPNQFNRPMPQPEVFSKPEVKSQAFPIPQINNQNIQGFAVPGQAQQSTPIQSIQPGKTMSLLGLLMNFSKENMALYKEQQEERKRNKSKKKERKNKKKSKNAFGFDIPSAPEKQNTSSGSERAVSKGFAIPGQDSSNNQQMSGFQSNGQNVWQQSPQQNSTNVQQMPQSPYLQQSSSVPSNTFSQGQRMNFGDTTVLNGGKNGETSVLSMGSSSEARQGVPYLIRIKYNEKILVNKPVYRIGKERSYVDYFVSDNTAVSRSHANIIVSEGMFFIEDTNSTNHTYVNGVMIQSNVKVRLSDGDKIRLANEDFEFKIE